MPNLIKSKRSTASDTATKKSRWFRPNAPQTELPELDQLLDLYWGGPERRITTLTTRIITVNAIALVMLMVGILFMGQYHANLIEAKLENFNTEISILSTSLSESTIENDKINTDKLKRIIERLGSNLTQRIRVFDKNKTLIIDSNDFETAPPKISNEDSLYTVRVLKNMAKFIIELLPEKRVLPLYPETDSKDAVNYPDATDAISGQPSLSAWNDINGNIFLSGAAPLRQGSAIYGAILLTRTAQDINRDIGDVWLNILSAFMITLIITVLLSIYLSGVIASPLRKLAKAAEGVRRGKLTSEDIPDFSARKDEIGELSIALREMTTALWARMDSIDRFAADVAHELKNPLTSLRSAIETVAIVKKSKDKEKLMGIVRHDIERLDRLITDISHASRLDSELSRDVFERIGLRGILHNIINVYKDPLQRKEDNKNVWENTVHVQGVTIEMACNISEDIFVLGHAGRLEQVFQNIIGNALSFAPKGSAIKICIKAGEKRVRIAFEDEGPGIPENKLNTVFERFYTQRPEHEDYGKHSGLGLSICKQIVIAMGGEISAENILDDGGNVTGARFKIALNKRDD